MTRSVVLTLAICGGAAILEGLMAGRGVRERFAELRLPRPSPSLKVWTVIGAAYYVICAVVLYRLLLLRPTGLRAVALSLTVIVLLANAFWNYLFFRVRSLGQSLVVSAVYSLVALVLMIFLTRLYSVPCWSF